MFCSGTSSKEKRTSRRAFDLLAKNWYTHVPSHEIYAFSLVC